MIFLNEFVKKLPWRILYHSGVAKLLSDELFIRNQYGFLMGKKLDLNHPSDFNQKLQWLKLYYKNPLLVTCSDKYAVREFVKNTIGEKYLNTIIGVYSNVDDIPFESLPQSFVLKATHGSGWNVICSDKTQLNIAVTRRKLKKWLRSDFSQRGREWQYRQIQPQIICESFIRDDEIPALRDYKIFTYSGECKYIWLDFCDPNITEPDDGVAFSKPRRTKTKGCYRNIYDTQWQLQYGKRITRPNLETVNIPPPDCLGEMLDVASALSQGFPHCRVDLYVVNGNKIIFGELTFTSGNGCNHFSPESFGEELGQHITLPK